MTLQSIHEIDYLLPLVVILIVIAYLIILSVRPRGSVEKPSKYVYFVAYYFVEGHGRLEITLDREITTFKDVSDIEKWIANEYKREPLVITNYILLRTDADSIDNLKYN